MPDLSPREVLTRATDEFCTYLARVADQLEAGVDPLAVAETIRAVSVLARGTVRPPMFEAEVRHAAAMLRVADPRAVIGGLGSEMAGGA